MELKQSKESGCLFHFPLTLLLGIPLTILQRCKVNNLTKAQEAGISKLENAIQTMISAGVPERPWQGLLPAEGKFPERETSNINVIVDPAVEAKVEKMLPALSGTGRYINAEFYGVNLICNGAYIGKVSEQPELQFTQMSVSRTNEHGTDEAVDQFKKVFGDGVKVHKVKADKVETPVEDDPFA